MDDREPPPVWNSLGESIEWPETPEWEVIWSAGACAALVAILLLCAF